MPPTFGDEVPDKPKGPSIVPGIYDGVLIEITAPFMDKKFKSEETELKVKGIYRFSFGDYSKFYSANLFDGISSNGSRQKPTQLFKLVRTITGVQTTAQARKIDRDQIRNIPVRGIFTTNDYGSGPVVSLSEVMLLEATAPPVQPQPQPTPTTTPPPNAQIPAPTIQQLHDDYIATGRSEEEFKGWFGVNTGYAKTVSPDMKNKLAKLIAELGPVGLESQMRTAHLDADEEVPF